MPWKDLSTKRAYDRAWKAKNKDKRRAQDRRYREKNKEKRYTAYKSWVERKKEEGAWKDLKRKYDRTYYLRHREKVIERVVNARRAQLEELKRERLSTFRSFVASLEDKRPLLPTPKRVLRKEIESALNGTKPLLLPPSPNKKTLTARPRRLWRRLSKRGLPINEGAR